MMSFETFKKQFDRSISTKTNEQILSEIEESGFKLITKDEKKKKEIISNKDEKNMKWYYNNPLRNWKYWRKKQYKNIEIMRNKRLHKILSETSQETKDKVREYTDKLKQENETRTTLICPDCNIELDKMNNGQLFCPDCLKLYNLPE